MLNLPQTTQLLLALIIENNTTVNGIPWHWRTMHCVQRHLRFCKYLGLMMACIGRNYSPLFKLIDRKIVVFNDVHILFHFDIIINTKRCPLLSTRSGSPPCCSFLPCLLSLYQCSLPSALQSCPLSERQAGYVRTTSRQRYSILKLNISLCLNQQHNWACSYSTSAKCFDLQQVIFRYYIQYNMYK